MKPGYARLARWLAVVVVAGVVAVVLLARGGGVAGVQPASVARAADTTTSVAGADIAMSMRLSIPGAAAPVTMSGAGYESFRSRQAQLSFRIAGLPTTGGGPSSLTFDMRMLYPTMFMRTPLLTGKLPAGKQWIKLNFATAVRQAGIDPTLLSSQQSDPSEYLSYLRAASGKVQNLGHEQIRGVSTTHYRATCDLSRYAERVPAAQRAAARASIARLTQLTGTSKLPVDVWIDQGHLVRQIRMLLSFSPPTGALARQRLREDITVQLFDFGSKPAVTAPPAGETLDVTKLAAAGLKK